MNEYRIEYYKNSRTGKKPVLEYIEGLREKEQAKIDSHLVLLKENGGRLVEPYCKHVDGKIWELRIQFSPNRHRILYVTVADKTIILLHAFTKKTEKLPPRELSKAYCNLIDALANIHDYYENK